MFWIISLSSFVFFGTSCRIRMTSPTKWIDKRQGETIFSYKNLFLIQSKNVDSIKMFRVVCPNLEIWANAYFLCHLLPHLKKEAFLGGGGGGRWGQKQKFVRALMQPRSMLSLIMNQEFPHGSDINDVTIGKGDKDFETTVYK